MLTLFSYLEMSQIKLGRSSKEVKLSMPNTSRLNRIDPGTLRR